MPKINNKEANILDKKTVDTIATLTKNTTDLESRIFGVSPMVGNELDYLKLTTLASIDSLTLGDGKNQAKANYQRLIDDSLDGETEGEALNLSRRLGEDSIEHMQTLSTIMMYNMPRAALYKDYDLICKFFPEMERAIEVMRDSILSPDNISKEVFSTAFSGSADSEEIKHRFDQLRKDYKLDKKVSNGVAKAIKYGEHSLFINTYSDEISKMMEDKHKIISNLSESVVVTETGHVIRQAIDKEVVKDSNGFYKIISKGNSDILQESLDGKKPDQLDIALDSMIEVCEYDQNFMNSAYELKVMKESMVSSEDLNEGLLSPDVDPTTKIFSHNPFFKNIRDKKLSRRRKGFKDNSKKIDIPGCVLKDLDTLRLYPKFAGDIVIGYWYVETYTTPTGSNPYDAMMSNMGQSGIANDVGRGVNATSLSNGTAGTLDANVLNQSLINRNDRLKSNSDFLMLSLARLAVRKLDKKYLETNPDMVEFIYNFCKEHNVVANGTGVKVTFLPPEQVITFKVNEDQYNRGVSKLAKSLFTAKLYVILLVSNFLTNTIRKNDMKAYYIKNGMNKNVTQTIMNAAYQIKKTQFNIHDVMDINRTFNIIGKNHELFIPVSENGDKPIDFDIISGDNGTGMENELLDFLKKASLNGLGVPPNLVDSLMDIDAVKPFVMANERFARSSIADQIDLEEPLNDLVNTLADLEIESFTYGDIVAKFPTPTTINNNNKIEKLNNNQNLVDATLKAYLGDAFMNTPDGPKLYDMMYQKLMNKIMPELFTEFDLTTLLAQCRVDGTKAKKVDSTGEATDDPDADSDVSYIADDED